MRSSGGTGCGRSPGSRGHAWCLHGDAARYRHCLADFFGNGLRDGRRVAYVSSDDAQAARADLADLGDLDRLQATDAVHLLSARHVYGAGGPIDPERVLASMMAATEQALDDGFHGLAISGDATEQVRTPVQRDAFARYEFLMDRYMASHPLSALCGYGLELGDDTVTEFAMLHGPSNEATFRVFGCADGAIGLAGEFDPVGVAALGRVLPRLPTADRGADDAALVIDMADVEYVDHRLLLMLDAYARGNGIAVSLRSAPPFTARLIELLPALSLHRAESGAPG